MPVTETFTDFKLFFDIIVPDTAAVIVAAGSSSRMGGTPKQLMNLAGVPVIMRTALAFERCDRIRDILLVAREEEIPLLQRLCDEYRITKLTDIVPGGATRARSVQNGIARCRDCAYVAIHDGARPLVSGEVILRTIEGAERVGAAAAAVGLKDTVKQTDKDGFVVETPDRATLRAVQTPQTFRLSDYRAAAEALGEGLDALTDDCAVMEAAGKPVLLVEGDYRNIKITTPEDMTVAEAFLREMEEGI